LGVNPLKWRKLGGSGGWLGGHVLSLVKLQHRLWLSHQNVLATSREIKSHSTTSINETQQ